MPGWQNSARRTTLPPNWAAIRTAILQRDGHRCTVIDDRGERCARPANDVDHIEPGNDHSAKNLRSICRPHHRSKSSAEGGRARWKKRPKRGRPKPQHPGLVEPPKRRRGA